MIMTMQQVMYKKQDTVNYLKTHRKDIYRDILNYNAYFNHFKDTDEDDFYHIFISVLEDAGISYEEHVQRIMAMVVRLLDKHNVPLTAGNIIKALKLKGVMDGNEMGDLIKEHLYPMVKFTRGGQFSFLYQIDKEFFNEELQDTINNQWWIDAKNMLDVGNRVDKALGNEETY